MSANQKSRTQRATGQERQASIIAAAASLFAQKGFNGTTTREIAKTAGISEALLFRYFPTKRALYAAILAARSQLSQLMASIEEAADKREDVRVFTLIASFRIHRGADPSLLRLLLFSALEGRSEEHTSELQSLAYLVCRLLLEKKKHTESHNTMTVFIGT